jgi:hypothetical protein
MRYIALVAAVALIGVATSNPGDAQTSLETQRGVPPAPSAASPEYAPSPVAPLGHPSPANPPLPRLPALSGIEANRPRV